jgi:DNA polymerase III subunit epsilon
MADSWITGELLAFDLETTGIDKALDVPVSYALVRFVDQEPIHHDAGLIDPGREIPPGASAVHGISTQRAREEGVDLEQGVRHIVEALLDASRRDVPVVGFNLAYDLSMMDARLRALDGLGLVDVGWHGPVLDPLVMDRNLERYRKGKKTLDLVCSRYGVVNDAAHDASGDAVASAKVLFAMAGEFPQQLADVDAKTLTIRQIAWHRSWAEGMHQFLTSKGGRGFDPDDFDWPLAGGYAKAIIER